MCLSVYSMLFVCLFASLCECFMCALSSTHVYLLMRILFDGAERVERIEKENYRLLERMTHIVNQKNTIDNKQTAIMPLVTGRQFRRRKELSKIQSENEVR